MATFTDKLTQRWKDAANLVLGLWLVMSPWVLSYAHETTPAWNAHVVGVIVAVAALSALIAFHQWEEWGNAVLAAWLIVSPYVLGFTHHTFALWNQLIVGVLVGALAIWAAIETPGRSVTAQN